MDGPSGDDLLASLFFTGEGRTDPAPLYRQLRETAPVHRSATGAIFLTRYDDCDRILRDGRFGKAPERAESGLLPSGDEDARRFREEQRRRIKARRRIVSMLFLDPPHHTRQRRLVSRAFTPRRVEALRSSIRHLAEREVGRLLDAGGGDLLELVGFPLPVAVIGTMVGVPEADWPQFRALVTTAAVGIEPGAGRAELERAETANDETYAYFVDLLAERRRRPADDLLSDLLAVDDAGDTLDDGEIIAVAMLLFAAGFETTTNLIGNGAAALLAHPAERAALWSDPDRIAPAVDEMLRWDSPVQFDVRRALGPADVAGEPVEDGQAVVTLLGAANRDPARFSDPDRFDPRRDEGAPLSFASGIHHCLGANLARAEGQEVFRALIGATADLEQDGPLVRRARMTLCGWEAVPVLVRPR